MSNQNSSSSRESDFDNDDSFADPDFEVETDVETRVGKSILSPSRQPLSACNKIEHLASTSKCLFPSNLEKNNCDLTELDCGPSNENLISIPSDYQSTESASNCSPLPKRKKSDPRLWKQHVRQQLRETGQQYVNIDGKTMPARIVKQPCKNSCFYLCTMNFTSHDRELTNAAFWSLTDQEKTSFYCKFIKREVVKRRRIRDSIKKRYSYNYYLQSEGRIHKVCKTFFINTLNISERRIYYYFQNLNDHSTGSPIPSKKGKNTKRATPPEQIRDVNNHIGSFPIVDSHYCRSSSTKKYLDAHLTVAKMYTLYRESRSSPVKESVYRKQFQAFNLSFHRPKKDQCDRCVLFKSNRNPTEEQISQQNAHKDDKIAMRAEREVDRQNGEPKHAIICFNLQSVFALPKGNASAFYYKRKLSLFNMTATCILINKPKITYCAMWSEVDSGRTGDDIASSIIKILNRTIVDNPDLKYITLWTDSCVAQNKNKVLSTALLYFLYRNPTVKVIVQKFSTPGHSLIQEVDCVHSVIDRHLKRLEIYSPLSLLHHLKNMSYKNVTLKIMEMKESDFKEYSSKAFNLDYSQVPFTKIKMLKFEGSNLFKLQFKTNARHIEYKSISLMKAAKRKTTATPKDLFSQNINSVHSKVKQISKEKIADIQSLFVFMPQNDQEYYKALLKIKYCGYQKFIIAGNSKIL